MTMIGVQTFGLTGFYGIDGAYKAIREAGFDAADANLDELLSYQDIVHQRRPAAFLAEGEESLAYFRPWKDAAEKYGVVNFQAHAPFPSWLAEGGEYNEFLMQALEKTIAGCAYVGCSRLVIHPFFNGYDQATTPEEEWALNLERYARLIPAAKRYGVSILLENMFTRHRGKIYTACCSDFDTACRYVDELNRQAGGAIFGFCLDTGHALLLGRDIRDVMVKLGGRIRAFHIHDNNGADDLHTAPYLGVLDWGRFTEGLRLIGYRDALCFETHGAVLHLPPELVPDMLRMIARTGRLFARQAGREE